MTRLDGHVAVITGGASGIGAEAVRRFAANGARVVIADIQDDLGEALAADVGNAAFYQRTDVSKEAEVEAMIAAAVDHFGGLDCLFNNAGFVGVMGPISHTPIDDAYASTVAVMFTGPLLGMKHAAPIMREQSSGSIINTASVAAVEGGFGPHVYSGIKAGVIGMTRSVAHELAPYSVRVNAICPGGIATPIFAPFFEGRSEVTDDEIVEVMRKRHNTSHPIPRSGEPADIANAAIFLASDESSFITGQHLNVDGGLTEMTSGTGYT